MSRCMSSGVVFTFGAGLAREMVFEQNNLNSSP